MIEDTIIFGNIMKMHKYGNLYVHVNVEKLYL